jgi:hypothetical protein
MELSEKKEKLHELVEYNALFALTYLKEESAFNYVCKLIGMNKGHRRYLMQMRIIRITLFKKPPYPFHR